MRGSCETDSAPLPHPAGDPRADRRSGGPEQRSSPPGVLVRRADDLLRFHAGGGYGQRPHHRLLPPPPAVMRRLRIRAGQVEAAADLVASPTADEIYFEIPVQRDAAPDAREVVQSGEIAYWPPGAAFCIFFGPTPASRGDEIRAASPVNVVGQIDGDAAVFKRVRGGTAVILERSE